MDMPKQDSDFGTVTCHGGCYILKGDDALIPFYAVFQTFKGFDGCHH
jgi:hypothetical protein